MAERTCSIEGCGLSNGIKRGWCDKHYQRWLKRGDPEFTSFIKGNDESRFWSKVEPAGFCWDWTGYRNEWGYGQFWFRSTMVRAHRFAYELLIGPIPDGLTLDHLCRNAGCVNPDHLDPVTMRENALRGHTVAAKHAATTACPQGHPYSDTNTYVNPKGSRECRTCKRARR